MDRLHQLFDNIKTLFTQAKNENRGRSKKRLAVVPFPMKQPSKRLW
jgi:hypothetical protein